MNTNTTTTPRTRSVLGQLRALSPTRNLTWGEAKAVAARQAHRFRILMDAQADYCFDTDLIAIQPRIRITTDSTIAAAGSSHWTGGHWQILLNANDHPLRRRFTLAHEYKHIIDHGSDVDPALEELICDYFAACLLMPKQLITSAWCNAEITQSVEEMAHAFGVSMAAMRYRLHDLGLLQRTDRRCAHPSGVNTEPVRPKIYYCQSFVEMLGSP